MTGIDDFLAPTKTSQVDDFLGVSKPGFATTIKRTGGQMLTTAATTAEDVTGPNRVTRAVRDIGQGVIDRNPAGITKLGDIAESPWLTVKEAVGQFVPQIGAAAAGAAVGARAGRAVGGAPGAAVGAGIGSLAPIFTQEYGGIRQEQQEGGQESIPRAVAAAGAATALERVGMGKALALLRGQRPDISTIPREILKGVGKEAGTEAAQTAIEQVGAFKDPTTPESLAETGLAGAMGGIGGGVVGGVQAGVQRALQPSIDAAPVPREAPGDPLRAAKLPETGPLTKGVNALIENEAQAADIGAPVPAPVTGALVGATPPPAPDATAAGAPGGGDQEPGAIPTGEATEADAEGMAMFDPASTAIAPTPRATFGSLEEVEQHLSKQRRGGGARQGKALPTQAADGRWTFAREGEPEFEGAQQAQQRREADERMRADTAFQAAASTMPQHLRELKPADRKLFGLDEAIASAGKPLATAQRIADTPGSEPLATAYTPEMAAMQAHNAKQAVKTQNGMLLSGNRTGATTGGLVGAWMNQQQAQRAIEESRKANPAMWAAYDERQKAMAELKPGDQVLTPYPSEEFPLGTPGKLVRKFGVNWRIEYPDGNTVMVPPSALRPGPRADTVAAQDSRRQESGAQTDPNATGNGNMAQPSPDAAPGAGQAEGEGAAAPSPGLKQQPSDQRTQDASPATGEDAPQARWTRATEADRTGLLADAGWSVNPPSLSTRRVLAQPWDKLTASQRDRITAALAKRQASSAIDTAANEAATSPQNDLPEPTDAQKEAGNYKKGHVLWNGLDLSIENPRGSERSGTDKGGKAWSVTMPAHYGYVKRTEGADGDQVDIYMGPDAESDQVFVVNQHHLETGKFDEHKAILGTRSIDEAIQLYDAGFSDGKGAQRRQSVRAMSVDDFKDWLRNGDTKAPAPEDAAAAPANGSGGFAAPASPAVARSAAPEPAAAPSSSAGPATALGLEAIPASEEAFVEAMQDAAEGDSAAAGDSDLEDFLSGERDRARAMFEPAAEKVTLPQVTSRKPKPPDVEFLTPEQAQERIDAWKAEAERQGREHASANAGRTVISLFDVSGVIAQPWVDAGYNVVSYDLQTGTDINEFNAENLLETHGNDDVWAILAQPPCTDYASSGAQYWKAKDADGRTEASNELVRQTLRTIELFRPAVWVLENPIGRIAPLNRLPEPTLVTDPWRYGDPYTKRTQLWGRFDPNLPQAPVEPTEGSKIIGMSSSAKNARSETPEGFAYAFFMANNAEGMPLGARLAQEFAGVERALFDAAVDAGKDAYAIRSAIEDSYYDNDLEMVREALRGMAESQPARPSTPNRTHAKPGAVEPATPPVGEVAPEEGTGETPAPGKRETPPEATPEDRWYAADLDERGRIMLAAGWKVLDSPSSLAVKTKPWAKLTEGQRKRLEAAMAAPAPAPAKDTIIGRRADGVMIRADERGVRFYSEGGMRIFETVSVLPGGGIQRGELRADWMTADERAAATDKAMTKLAKDDEADRAEQLSIDDTVYAKDGAAKGLVRGFTDDGKVVMVLWDGTNSRHAYPRDQLTKTAPAAAEPVASLYGDGRPDPKNSAPLPELDGWKPGDRFVAVDGRTTGPGVVELLFTRALAGFDDPSHLARIKSDERAHRLDVDIASLQREAAAPSVAPAVETAAPTADTSPQEAPNDSAAQVPAPTVDQPVAARPAEPAAGEPARGEGAGARPADDGGLRAAGAGADGAADARQDVGNRRGSGRVPDGAPDAVERSAPRVLGDDYRAFRYPGSLTREGSWQETARRNLDLIDLARKIEAEGRPATPDEQAQLAKYVGFGAGEIRNRIFPVPSQWQRRANPDALIFPESVPEASWRALAERAAALPVEWQRTILQSTQYAHYTSENLIRQLWASVQRLGFTGGKVFEPGMGIGNFPMLMPDTVRATSRYTGIEFDGPTALIAKLLSPQQHVLHDDFIKRSMPDDFFDLAIGNPPFSQTKVLADPRYEKHGFMLHDYFFAKSLDKVRPGGLLVFVTSKGTMDKKGDRARRFLAERADLLGAIRLPSTAFEGNAGTSVVTDVLFLRKRLAGEQPGGMAWNGIKEAATPDGPVLINEYFVDHPEMVLGQNRISGNTDDQGRRINSNGVGGERYTVVGYDATPAELEAKVQAALERLPANAYSALAAPARQVREETAKVDFDPKVRREGVIYLDDEGVLRRVEEGVGKELGGDDLKLSDKDRAWFKSYVGLRELVQEARYAQVTDGDWKAALAKLNKAYDAFVKKHGPVNAFRVQQRKSTDEDGNPVVTETRIFINRRLLREDYDSAIVTSLETIDEDGTVQKAPFLKTRTIGKPVAREVKTIGDALAVSLDERGALDLDDVAQRLRITRQEAIEALGTQVYRAPSGEWQLADEYLSGNVVEKLAQAEAAARLEPDLERNVTALREVQPEKLGPSQISVKLGAPWVDARYVSEFAKEIGAGEVTYDTKTESWQVEGGNLRSERKAGADYGTAERSPSELLEAALNSRQVKVMMKVPNDSGTGTKEVVNNEATTLAAERVAKIKDKFKSWVWTDTERAADLVEAYNKRYNNLAPRRFDGSHLTLPGVSLRFKLHPHQLRAIWRQVQVGDTYLAHAVGAGKTIEMIAGGMEQKRVGLIKKPIYVVPNHMLEQFANEFMELYPLANIMVADDQNFSRERRKAFVAAATLNAPDAVIITQSGFERIGVKPESVEPIKKAIISDLEDELDGLEGDSGARVRRGQLEQQIEAVNQRFDSIMSAGKKDNLITFEEMGVDFLYADEAHAYRKLDFHTSQSIKGIDPNGSRRALDMYVKTRYLQKQRPGRAMVFASGTPVTNTMGELFTIQRFFDQDALDQGGISTFDSWARMFGEVAPALEPNAAGRYEMVTRFAKFDNVPELMSRVRMFMDVLQSDQLGAIVKRPDLKGGKPELVIVPPTKALKQYQQSVLLPRLEASRAWKPSFDQPNNPDPVIAIITDGRFAASDPRFFGGKIEPGETTKIDAAADRIIEKHKATAGNVYVDRDGTPMAAKGSTQIVFYNVGFGANAAAARGFDSRRAFTKRLTDGGIPASQIAWFDDADTDAKKEAIFKGMRRGQIRVLIGSAKKMGTGVNVQNRLKVLHYMDPPWYPADVEQPHGRIIRQGNQNDEVEIYWYATKGGYDSTMWQMVGRKQRFIDQAFSGDKNLRSMDDLGEASQYEQAAALASGDPRAIQLAGLKQDVERLERQQAAHANEQLQMRGDLRSAEWGIESAQAREKTYVKALEAIGGGYFTFTTGTVGRQAYTKLGEFGQALKDAFNKGAADFMVDGKEERQLGAIGDGITLEMTADFAREVKGKGDKQRIERNPTGYHELSVTAGGYSMNLGSMSGMGADVDAVGLGRKVVNALNGVDAALRNTRSYLAEQKTEVARLRKKLGAPFEHQQEMLEKHAALKTLEAELKAEGEAAAAEAAAKRNAAKQQAQAQDGDAGPVADLAQAARRSGVANPSTVASARAEIASLFGSDADRVVTVVANVDALPEEIAPLMRRTGGRAVTVNKSRIYIVADRAEPGTVRGLVMHELGVHYGMAKADIARLSEEVMRWAEGSGVLADQARWAVRAAAGSASTNRDEEVLAYMVQALVDSGVTPTTGPMAARRFLNMVLAAAKAVLRALGVPLQMTPQDVVDFTYGAAKLALRRGSPPKAVPGVQFSQQASPLRDALNSARDLKLPAQYRIGDLFDQAGTLSWWHKSVGTMHNLAQRDADFRRVYDSTRAFIDDTSFYATEAADLAPRLLPKLETWRDITKSPIAAADAAAIRAPIFEGTLTWARDEDGNAVPLAQLEARAADMSTEQKAREMLRRGLLTEQVLKMWQGMPVDHYDAAINTRYENEVLVAGVVFSDAELRQQFKLTPEQIKLYREFRGATDRSITNLAISDMLRYGGEDVEEVRERALASGSADRASLLLRDHLFRLAEEFPDRAGVLNDTANRIVLKGDRAKSLIEHGYAPLMRFGQFTLDVLDEAGERVYFGLFETTRERARMARQMREAYPKGRVSIGTTSQEDYRMFAGVSPETVELFGELLGLEAQGEGAANEAFQTYLKRAKSTRSAMKRLIQRKGIAGFSEDAGRVLAGFVMSNARQTSGNLHTGEVIGAVEDIPQSKGQLKDAAVQLTEYVRNPVEEAQGIRGLLFFQYLGGSVASAMVNALQPLQVTFPYLSQYTSVAKAAAHMARATADALKRKTGDDELDRAMHVAAEKGIVSPQEVHQLIGQASGRATLQSGDGTKLGDAAAAAANALSRLQLAWGKVFGVAEQFNRRATFIAAYRIAVERGMPNPGLFAEKAINDTQFVYSKANRPKWARGAVGSVLFTFKTYSINYVELLHRMATRGGPEGRKAALLALGVLFIMSGAAGLPGSDDLDDLIDGLLQRLGYNYQNKAQRQRFFAETMGLGDVGARFLEHGVSALPGIPLDVSGRLGLGNLVPGTRLFTKKRDYGRDVAEIAGPVADLAQRTFEAGGKLLAGEPLAAAERISPVAAQNLTKGLEMATTGIYKDQSGKKVLDVDGYDAAVKAIGFQPADVARVQRAARSTAGMIELNKIREAEIADAWAKGVADKDPDAIAAARADLAAWNRDNPESPIRITMQQIQQRVRSLTMSRAERLERTAPREIRGEVRRQLEAAQE